MAGAPLGNRNSAKGRPWRYAIERALDIRSRVTQRDTLVAIADKVIDLALDGDMTAVHEIAERIEGKSRSMIEHHMEQRIEEMSRDELVAIASSARASEEDGGERVVAPLRLVDSSPPGASEPS